MRRSRTIFPRQSRGENGNLFVPFGAIFIATGREEFARRNCGIAREFVFFFFLSLDFYTREFNPSFNPIVLSIVEDLIRMDAEQK